MATLEEVKTAIEAQAKGTQALRDHVEKKFGDVVDQTAFKQLEEMVAGIDKERKKIEAEYLKELKEAKALAEEASLKAGRRGGGGGETGPSEADIEHKTTFLGYLRARGNEKSMSALQDAEEKAIGSPGGSGPGVAVPTVLATDIDRKTSDESVMQSLVHSVTVGTSDYRKTVNKGGVTYGWVEAGDDRDPTTAFDIYQAEPTMGTIYAYPEFQEEQLDDVFFNLEEELTNEVVDAFANGRDDAIVGGNGIKKPTGMLATAPVSAVDGVRADKVFQYVASGQAANIGGPDQLMRLVYTLKRRYRRNASWIMNDLTTVQVRTMKDGDGRFLWADGLQAGQPDRLLGYNVNMVDAMPDIAANSTPIGFGDWKRAYTHVTRHGLRVLRESVTKPGFVRWHIRQREGGMPTNDDAAKFLKAAVS